MWPAVWRLEAQSSSIPSDFNTKSLQATALAVNPAIFEAVLEPGRPLTKTVQVHNLSSVPMPVKVQAKDFTPQEEIDPADRALFDASAWFTIEKSDFILGPNEYRTVEITVAAPAGAEPGGHYATIYFQPLVPADMLAPNGAYVAARVGVLAFLVVPGDIEQNLDGRLRTAVLQQSGPTDVILTFKNTGNTHLRPVGALKLLNWRGREVARLDLKPIIVLPGTEKELKLSWDQGRLLGSYNVVADITYGTEQTKLDIPPVYFWAVPWAGFIGILLLIGPLMYFLMTKRRRNRLTRAWRTLIGRRSQPY